MNIPENTKDILVESMERASKTKKKRKRKRNTCIAAVLAVLIAVPNISPSAAGAMESIPVLGNLFSVITVRDYKDDSERYSADVKIPHIKASAGISSEAADEINRKIDETCNTLIAEYETAKKELADEGYEDLVISSETVSDSEDYFTLKLSLYTGAGSGYLRENYYTIDKSNGSRVNLSDIISENDKKAINKEIVSQMKAQMKEDSNITYFIGDKMGGFTSVSDNQDFYFDGDGNLVICFDEYEVAPGFMGCVSFTIDKKIF